MKDYCFNTSVETTSTRLADDEHLRVRNPFQFKKSSKWVENYEIFWKRDWIWFRDASLESKGRRAQPMQFFQFCAVIQASDRNWMMIKIISLTMKGFFQILHKIILLLFFASHLVTTQQNSEHSNVRTISVNWDFATVNRGGGGIGSESAIFLLTISHFWTFSTSESQNWPSMDNRSSIKGSSYSWVSFDANCA